MECSGEEIFDKYSNNGKDESDPLSQVGQIVQRPA